MNGPDGPEAVAPDPDALAGDDSGPGPSARRVEIEAPAKVNLLLRVLGRDEATGYHDVETVFQAVALADRITVEVGGLPGAASPIRLSVVGADVGPAEDNLVTRAARAFLARSRLDARLDIRLEKRIPAGAGLGGGSSDAASTLRALNALFGDPLEVADLHDLARDLGSDVPFFLCGSPTALGWGRGDRLRPWEPLPVTPVLLVLPGVHVATREAYRMLARARAEGRAAGSSTGSPTARRARRGAGPALADLGWDSVRTAAENDFETVVPTNFPAVAGALKAIRATEPRMALLSGSGSAVFGVYSSAADRSTARETLAASGHIVVESVTLERMPRPRMGSERKEPGGTGEVGGRPGG